MKNWKNERMLLPTKQLKKLPKILIGVFDIETDGLGGDYIYGGAKIGDSPVVYFNTMDDLVDHIFQNPDVIWYAHNGGGYDCKYMFKSKRLIQRLNSGWGCRIITSGKSIVIGLIFNRLDDEENEIKIEIRDSYKLSGLSLDKSAKAFKVHEKKSGSIDFDNEKFDPKNPIHIEYLESDIIACYEFVNKFRELVFDKFGCSIGWTAPSTAVKAFQNTLKVPYIRINEHTEEFIRLAYYGAMTRPGKLATESCTYYDRNSAYASIMKENLPAGNAYCVKEFDKNNPGFYNIKVECPQNVKITVIPLRTKTGVIFPTGKFETYASSDEIKLSIKLGYKIEVIKGYIFLRSEPVCKEFIEKCESLRHEDYFGPIGELAKLIQNALYGKFGSKPEGEEVFISNYGAFGARLISDPNGKINLWSRTEKRQAPYMHIEWAAWITARERVALAEAILASGVENFVYCDTDSVITEGKLPDDMVGKEYGKWKIVKDIKMAVVCGPKTYGIVMMNGEDESKCKGIPRRLIKYQDIKSSADGNHPKVLFDSTTSLIVGIKSGKPIGVQIEREISNPYSSSGWVLENNRYMPINI